MKNQNILIILLIVLCLIYYYYNNMEHYSLILNPNPTTIKKVSLNSNLSECSREAIDKAEYNYVVNPINRGLRPVS